MLVILRPCNSCYFPDCAVPPKAIGVSSNVLLKKAYLKPLLKPQKFSSFATTGLSNTFSSLISRKLAFWSTPGVAFCSKNGESDGFSSTQLSQESVGDIIQEPEKLGLLNKPSPLPDKNGSPSEVDMESGKSAKDEEEALAPFMKFFKGSDSVEEAKEEGGVSEVSEEKIRVGGVNEETKKINVEYYEPKPGDFVVGVVVSGNENKLDVNVGANFLGTMLTKEVLPLYGKEIEYLLCDLNKDSEKFMVPGKMGLVKDDDVISGIPPPGRPVVEVGTILFAEVLGRTLSGRPLLSTRRLFRRMAWHRVMQIKQLNEPIEVRITEWNTGGLLTRIEGLRAFLPKAELMKRVNSISELKDYVGHQMSVQISRVDEATNNLILNEREAWEKLYLREGTLLDGTVKKIFPYGAQVRIGETNRSGLLHVSNITRAEVTAVSDILSVDEKVKVLVVKSLFPDKISLSIADLESEPGLFLSNKERVFEEAKMMAKKYKEKLPPSVTRQRSDPPPTSSLPFENETLYANWHWFQFEKE
ncbi:protein PIGMENT DEFECTIVE 338, chloroplastic [Prosopis cineraria]|uniref:protein PIGMENT DEFECTIVE 338, chloroplastic n=1 Tax=Prosopis cineraria TaxID=364024 RepID=UPI0024104A00|nr:protein PIGMENT DEFECTIVE 338, chloroplastic [Prosopis cineraria]